jgi:hypothetical protein
MLVLLRCSRSTVADGGQATGETGALERGSSPGAFERESCPGALERRSCSREGELLADQNSKVHARAEARRV